MTHPSREAQIEVELEGHRIRNEALVVRLRELHVALDQPRAVDLHFFAPNVPAAEEIAAALEMHGLHGPKLSTPGADGTVSLEVTGSLAVNVVVSRPFIEPLVRIASASGGTHDGWGTSVKEGGESAG